MLNKQILIIGAINIDINVKTDKSYQLHDSNPVQSTINVGGVGGNIAQNMARLGCETSIITVLSTDALSAIITAQLQALNINFEHSFTVQKSSTNLYISTLDEQGDLFLGVNDMRSLLQLTPSLLKPLHEYINSFDTIILDNNLTQETLIYLAQTYRDKRLIIDAVSSKKVGKLAPLIDYVNLIKMNSLEYKTFLNQYEDSEITLHHYLVKGSLELLISDHDNTIMLYGADNPIVATPVPCPTIVSTSGAGDALLSGYVYGLLQNYTKQAALQIGIRLAYQTLLVPESTTKEVRI